MHTRSDVIIIGAGAAGMMCAIEAGRRGRSVLVLDHARRAGNKVRISGGGRCNFTNLGSDASHYISRNPDFCVSALARYSPYDFLRLAEKNGVKYEERDDGRLFCAEGARQILRMLLRECRLSGTKILLDCRVKSVRKERDFSVVTSAGTFHSSSLVVATGGLSYPHLGATDIGFRLARHFGLRVVAPRPALVPLFYSGSDRSRFGDLSGISCRGEIHCGDTSFTGEILFTHQGLSGPAILQASSFWHPRDPVTIDLMPGEDIFPLAIAKRRHPLEMRNLLAMRIPRRLARKWCELYAPSKPLTHYSEKELLEVSRAIHRWTITPAATGGYDLAEVTLGGVDTVELSSQTMQSRSVEGLFFVGEVVDVTGHLGGYNLQWAWSSGWAAGQAA